jgi:hypothetical protein
MRKIRNKPDGIHFFSFCPSLRLTECISTQELLSTAKVEEFFTEENRGF